MTEKEVHLDQRPSATVPPAGNPSSGLAPTRRSFRFPENVFWVDLSGNVSVFDVSIFSGDFDYKIVTLEPRGDALRGDACGQAERLPERAALM